MVMLISILNNVQYLQMLFLALKKVQIVKMAPPQISATWWFFLLFPFPTTGGNPDIFLLILRTVLYPSTDALWMDSVKHIKWIFWLQEFHDLKLMLMYNYFWRNVHCMGLIAWVLEVYSTWICPVSIGQKSRALISNWACLFMDNTHWNIYHI